MRYLTAYVGGDKRGGVVFGNEIVNLFEDLTVEDIEEIKAFIATKKKLNTVTILNIIRL